MDVVNRFERFSDRETSGIVGLPSAAMDTAPGVKNLFSMLSCFLKSKRNVRRVKALEFFTDFLFSAQNELAPQTTRW
jgi:hypothetical protein